MINREYERQRQMRRMKTWRLVAVVTVIILGYLTINGVFTILERRACNEADTHTYVELRCWEVH